MEHGLESRSLSGLSMRCCLENNVCEKRFELNNQNACMINLVGNLKTETKIWQGRICDNRNGIYRLFSLESG